MFDINAKKQRNKQKKYYEIFLSPMHGAPPPPQKKRKIVPLRAISEKKWRNQKVENWPFWGDTPSRKYFSHFLAFFGPSVVPKNIYFGTLVNSIFKLHQTIDKYACKNILKEICHLLPVGVGLGLVEVWLVSRQPPWPTFLVETSMNFSLWFWKI